MKTPGLLSLFFGSCLTMAAQNPSFQAVSGIPELSGMVEIRGSFWGLNDSDNPPLLYRFDPATGKTTDSTSFANASNVDWEELACNGKEVFIGDFGNNDGSRKNLRLFRFPADSLGKKLVRVDTISFYYPEQTDFTPFILSNWDCEAMLAGTDSIILFSKSKADGICRVYMVPNEPGRHAARLAEQKELNFWVTGAARGINGSIALCGYVYLGSFSNFLAVLHPTNSRPFSGITCQTSLTLNHADQLESLIYPAADTFLLGCEASSGNPAGVYTLQSNLAKTEYRELPGKQLRISRDGNTLTISNSNTHGLIEVFDTNYRRITSFPAGEQTRLDIGKLSPGWYILQVSNADCGSGPTGWRSKFYKP